MLGILYNGKEVPSAANVSILNCLPVDASGANQADFCIRGGVNV